MSTATATSLRVRAQKLSHPMHFKQMDGSLSGGQPAIHVIERVMLEIGRTKSSYVPKMMEEVILGLAWLDKWGPTMWCGVVGTCG